MSNNSEFNIRISYEISGAPDQVLADIRHVGAGVVKRAFLVCCNVRYPNSGIYQYSIGRVEDGKILDAKANAMKLLQQSRIKPHEMELIDDLLQELAVISKK